MIIHDIGEVKCIPTDGHIQVASHYPLAHNISVIKTLADGENSICIKSKRLPNYNISTLFTDPITTPTVDQLSE